MRGTICREGVPAISTSEEKMSKWKGRLTELLADRSKVDPKVAHALILEVACRMKLRGGAP